MTDRSNALVNEDEAPISQSIEQDPESHRETQAGPGLRGPVTVTVICKLVLISGPPEALKVTPADVQHLNDFLHSGFMDPLKNLRPAQIRPF